MKKRILVAALVSTLTVGAFAQGMMNNQQGMQKQQKMWNQCSMHNRTMMHSGMQMFSQLNLSNEQRFQLSILRDEMRLEMKKLMYSQNNIKNMGEFIEGNFFDKSAFKENMNKKHEKMLDLRADNMEKVFKILTKEQILELKNNFAKM